MRRIIAGLLLLTASATSAAQAQTLNCQSAFTRLEQAICDNPALSALHTQFSDTADNAVAAKQLSPQGAALIRNNIARACRSSTDLNTCLTEEMSDAIGVLSASGVAVSTAQDTGHEQNHALQLAGLQKRLPEAEEIFVGTGDPEYLIVTLLALLQHYAELAQVSETAIYESRAIRLKLLAGCTDLNIRSKWNKALQAYGWACPITHAANSTY